MSWRNGKPTLRWRSSTSTSITCGNTARLQWTSVTRTDYDSTLSRCTKFSITTESRTALKFTTGRTPAPWPFASKIMCSRFSASTFVTQKAADQPPPLITAECHQQNMDTESLLFEEKEK